MTRKADVPHQACPLIVKTEVLKQVLSTSHGQVRRNSGLKQACFGGKRAASDPKTKSATRSADNMVRTPDILTKPTWRLMGFRNYIVCEHTLTEPRLSAGFQG